VRRKPHRETGEPKGRPLGSSIPLHKHPKRLVLGCADMLIWLGGFTNQKAYLVCSAYMWGTDDGPIPFNEMTDKIRRHFERGLTVARRLKLPRGSMKPDSIKIKECIPTVDTLARMSRRYVSEEDMKYRSSMAALICMVVFGKDRAQRILTLEMLVRQLHAENDPQIKPIVEQLMSEA
jgi:hypothetical protein